jgi:hypothetical protein
MIKCLNGEDGEDGEDDEIGDNPAISCTFYFLFPFSVGRFQREVILCNRTPFVKLLQAPLRSTKLN